MSSDKFAELTELSRRLNKDSDEVTSLIEQFEKKLKSLSLGIEIWLSKNPLQTDINQGDLRRSEHKETWLGYARLENKWALAVKDVRVCDGQFDGDENMPYREVFDLGNARSLVEASRLLRLEAVPKLGRLLGALKAKTESLLAELEKAKSTVGGLAGTGSPPDKKSTKRTAGISIPVPAIDASALEAIHKMSPMFKKMQEATGVTSAMRKQLADAVNALSNIKLIS